MTEKILSALKSCGIEKYFVTEHVVSSAELFFIKKKLDLARGTDTTSYSVMVYKDFRRDGKDLTGAAQVKLEDGESPDIIADKLKKAYEACEYAGNPAYSFDEGVKDAREAPKNGLSSIPLNEAALKAAEALYKNDVKGDPLVNSAEIFVTEAKTRIIGGNGCDVSYARYTLEGEFVAQCKVRTDVEMHHTFSYDDLDLDELSEKVKEALETVVSRSLAERTAPRGERRVILSDKCVKTVMEYYGERAYTALIYPGYSNFRKEMDVMAVTGEVVGDRITMKLAAKEPFSNEGIPMVDRVLLDKGVLKTIHGNTRLASYLGEKPTGVYRAASVECGTMPYEEMKADGALHVVSFSDFQMDAFSGNFGGEIRLAYLYENGERIPVTGGSVNGNFIELQKNIRLSSEKQKSSTFEGPKYIMFENVPVNGE